MWNFISFRENFKDINPLLASNALAQYRCFMYLHKMYPDSLLIPTLDIEFVWRSHCTRPAIYQKDCMANAGKIISHALCPSVALRELHHEALKLTRNLWRTHFNVDYADLSVDELLYDDIVDELSCELHHLSFMWGEAPRADKLDVQVSLTQQDILDDHEWFHRVYRTMSPEGRVPRKTFFFWPSLLKCYEKYLYMCAISPAHDQLANPWLLIDLVWHVHMLHPEEYISDMKRIVGHVLNHGHCERKQECIVTWKEWERQFDNKYEEEGVHLLQELVEDRALIGDTIKHFIPAARIVPKRWLSTANELEWTFHAYLQ
eukprot:TRINITY_DN24595_c0_g1_i7.p1 TRINITY_DN24595_c0_g1~~TRINITY_DN24595_c0_g1_i7.p1  ORF type:complete len:317 (-),score=53.32 TRINITY_DN24595_c0_g1_i7:126-1076(-)